MRDLSLQGILTTLLSVALVMISASIHEFGHGYVAYLLGDDTAKRAGRLTLNPLAHLDPTGSVLLPVLMSLAGGPVFGFAKPVPYNPRKLKNPRRDELLVALAGPATNLLQAAAGAIACRLLLRMAFESIVTGGYAWWAYLLFSTYVFINCSLAFFNLIPLPPLDGSAIVAPLLKGEALRRYYVVQSYAMPILLICLYVLPGVLGFDPIDLYLNATAGRVADLFLGW